MTKKKIWFGNAEKMMWVNCPSTNIRRGRGKWEETGGYLNGGAYAVSSPYSHRKYSIDWNLMESAEAAKIMSFYEGVYGQSPIQFVDPFAAKSNILPLHWSVPRLCAKDAPNLLPAGSARPVEVSAAIEMRRNLASDPRATTDWTEVGQARWAPRWYGIGGAGTTTAVSGATDGPEVAPGVRIPSYLRKAWTAAGTVGDTGFEHTVAASTGGLPIVAGWTYTLSSYMRASRNPGGGTSAHLKMAFHDAAGVLIGSVHEATTPLVAGEWVRASLTVVAPGGAAFVSLFSDISGSDSWQPGDTLDGTGLLVEVTWVLGPYFDGATSPGPDLTPSWVGTPNASQSVLNGYIEGCPRASAQFIIAGTDSTNPTLRIPVPPGKNFYLSVRGVASGSAGVRVIPDRGSAVTLAPTWLVTPTTTTLNNPGGVTLRLTGTGTFTLNSMRATVGTSAPDYNVFSQGEGNTGLRFVGEPNRTGYSSVLDLESVSAEFVEVGAWE